MQLRFIILLQFSFRRFGFIWEIEQASLTVKTNVVLQEKIFDSVKKWSLSDIYWIQKSV